MDGPYPLNLIGLLLLGPALLWAVRLVYGAALTESDDLLRRSLRIVAWLWIHAGLLGFFGAVMGPLGLIGWVIVLVILAMGLGKYQDYERRALLWALAVAAEKGIALHVPVRAFSLGRGMSLGGTTQLLADLLERGLPLPEALHRSHNPLPLDALLAARLGQQTGMMGPALRQAVSHVNLYEAHVRSVIEKLLYLMIVSWVAVCGLSFLMLKIIPVISMMMSEFGLAMPKPTELLITASEYFMELWFLGTPLFVLLMVVTAISLLYYVGWLRTDLPLLGRVWIRGDGAMVLRSLALTIRQQRAIPETLEMLAIQYPKSIVRRRLSKAVARIRSGTPWLAALRSVGLLGRAEAAVLESAERVGNLPWALDEMADSIMRRLALRLNVALNVAFPIVVLLISGFVMLYATGVFLPLVSLTMGLS